MIQIYDSVCKHKVKFEEICKQKVKIYICGPTVYDSSHLGHARSAIAFDLLHRMFKLNNFEVIISKNFTDIDDKIIKKMNEKNLSLEEITNKYINEYKDDMKNLNILENSLEPKATENISIMLDMIDKLLVNDIAYIIDDGVYFDISKDDKYGSISHKVNEENSKSRIANNIQKRNQADFALWKFEKANDTSYKARFGKGRPGWHLECSAMIDKHLAYKNEDFQIDIHCGGADLLFPHHENEAAQTRCSTKQNLAKYWMHNGFVQINNEKMSKSLGNSFFLKDIFKEYSGELIRFYLLSSHYRSDFNFSEEDLLSSKKRLDRLYRLKKRVYLLSSSKINKLFFKDIMSSLNDDLNSPKALGILDEFITKSNELLDKDNKNKNAKKEILASFEFIEEVLGIGFMDAYEYFQYGINEDMILEIKNLISKRNEAKRNKDFLKSDEIRDEISKLGISIMDTIDGVVWEKV